ncbi:hypothetical protein BHE74_00058669 [Ensete ventricosum]|nr:hypothetical protein BHE74_00058669 [Ensete ventricosum]
MGHLYPYHMVRLCEPGDWLLGSRGCGSRVSYMLGFLLTWPAQGTRSEGPVASVSGSSSLGIPSPGDSKSLRDLKVMKSFHDVILVVSEESLGSIRERYSIPKEYALQAPLPEQRPYNPESSKLSISVDALEAGLRFPFIPSSWNALDGGRFLQVRWRPTYGATLLRAMDLNALRRKPKMLGGKNSSATRAESSPSEVEEISVETTPKRLVGTARGKEPTAPTEEDSSPTYLRLKSMKDLCDMRVHKDNEGYYVLYIADWTPKDLNVVMRARWLNLTYSANVWDNSQVASEFERGVLHRTLAKDLYMLPFEVLMAQATKQITLIKEQKASCRKADNDLLKMMKENETLKAELPSKSIVDYKQTLAFKLGYPDLEVDSDLFTEKPEDSSVPIETRQEFDDSVPTEE